MTTNQKILDRIIKLEDRVLSRLDEGKKITQTQVNTAADLQYDYQDYSAELLDKDEAAYDVAVTLLEERIDSLVQGIDLLYEGDESGKDYILDSRPEKSLADWKCKACGKSGIEAVDTGVRRHSLLDRAELSEDRETLTLVDFLCVEYHDTGEFSHYECRDCGTVITEEEIVKFLKGE